LQFHFRSFLACVTVSLTAAICLAAARGQLATPRNKSSQSAAEQKIDSQLLIEIEQRERASRSSAVTTIVRIDGKGRALVDLRADVTPSLLKTVRSAGGVVVSSSVEYHSIVAWVPLAKIKRLTARADVRAIMPAAEATTNRGP